MALINIGIRIKELRKKNGYSQEELAEKLDMQRVSLYRIEAGRTQPSLPLLQKICEILNVTLEELFQAPELPPHLRSLLEAAQELKPEQVELLTRFISSLSSEEK